MGDVEAGLPRWSWLAWQDATTGEVYGESTELELALELSERLATEPIIDSQPRPIALYQEPGHRLLRLFSASGVKVVNELRLQPPEAPAPAARGSHYGHGARNPRARKEAEITVSEREEVLAFQELSERRRQAGVPADGRYFSGATSYAVALDAAGEVIFVEADRAVARARAQELKAQGQDVVLVDSLDFEPLD
jgi:hypothetical protein